MIFLKRYYIETTEEVDVLSIIHEVNYAIKDSGAKNGFVTITVPESGAGLVIMEPLDEVISELKVTMDMFGGEGGETVDKKKNRVAIAPRVQAALLGRSLNIPIQEGRIVTAPYEEPMLVDFENKRRRREVIIQVFSEEERKEGERQQVLRRR